MIYKTLKQLFAIAIVSVLMITNNPVSAQAKINPNPEVVKGILKNGKCRNEKTNKPLINSIVKTKSGKYLTNADGRPYSHNSLIRFMGGKTYLINDEGRLASREIATVEGHRYLAKKDGSIVTSKDCPYTFNGLKYNCTRSGIIKPRFKVKKWILVGDSRYVQMSRVDGLNHKNDCYIAKGAMGLNWMKKQEKRIKNAETSNSVIVIGMGINDTYYTKEYVTYLKKTHFKSPVYFCMINPVDHRKYHGFSNKRVEHCNEVIRGGMKAGNYRTVGTYDMLISKGYNTFDGLHYTPATYKKIYSFIKKEVVKDLNR